jgi:hypothetical protein
LIPTQVAASTEVDSFTRRRVSSVLYAVPAQVCVTEKLHKLDVAGSIWSPATIILIIAVWVVADTAAQWNYSPRAGIQDHFTHGLSLFALT